MPSPSIRPLRLAALTLAALAALAGAGCTECEDDYDCGGTLICAEGVCEAFVCRCDEDCLSGYGCVENICKENPAQAAPDAPDAVVIRPGG